MCTLLHNSELSGILTTMKLIDLNFEDHGSAVQAIFNEAIANSTALYEYQPRSIEVIRNWFDTKAKLQLPVIGLVSSLDHKELHGFSSYGPFRPFPAFKYTVEHSVYVAAHARGQGLGKLLLKSVIERAQANDVHVMVAGIDASNQASIALHQKHGFEASGVILQSGFKFGRWLDLAFYQLILQTPTTPVDG